MLNKIKEFVQRNSLFEGCGHIVLGLSGGADSVCLLYILNALSEEYGYEITAIHVHHGIRGSEADRDAEFCRKLCEKMNIRYEIRYVNIPEVVEATGESTEEAGRRIRYEIFEEEAAKLEKCKIAVAHHANDRVETILFNLIRGTGLKGLHGIRASRDNIIRPLLGCTRDEIEKYLSEIRAPFCIDSTNLCNDYTRNKLRNNIIPAMEEINCAAVKNISALSDRAEELEDFVNSVVEMKYQECVVAEPDGILLSKIEKEHPFIAKNIIMRAIEAVAGRLKDITDAHINAVYELLGKNAGSYIDVKYGVIAKREVDGIFVFKKAEKNFEQKEVKISSLIPLENGKFIKISEILSKNDVKISNQLYTKYFDYDKINFNLQIRTRKDGDYLVVDREGHKKTINRYFIDEKIPGRIRDELLLLADGSHIIWVIGYRISEAYKITKDTVNVLCVEYGGTEHA